MNSLMTALCLLAITCIARPAMSDSPLSTALASGKRKTAEAGANRDSAPTIAANNRDGSKTGRAGRTVSVADLRYMIRTGASAGGWGKEVFSDNDLSIGSCGLFDLPPQQAGLEFQLRNKALGAAYLEDVAPAEVYARWRAGARPDEFLTSMNMGPAETKADTAGADSKPESRPASPTGAYAEELERLYREAEIWATMATLEGAAYPSRDLDRALRQYLFGLSVNGLSAGRIHDAARTGERPWGTVRYAWHDAYHILHTIRDGAVAYLASHIRCNRGKTNVLFHSLGHARTADGMPFIPPVGCQCVDTLAREKADGKRVGLSSHPTLVGGFTRLVPSADGPFQLVRGEGETAGILIERAGMTVESVHDQEEWTHKDIVVERIEQWGEGALLLVGSIGPCKLQWDVSIHPSGSFVDMAVTTVSPPDKPVRVHLGMLPVYERGEGGPVGEGTLVDSAGLRGKRAVTHDGTATAASPDAATTAAESTYRVKRWLHCRTIDGGTERHDGLAVMTDAERVVTVSPMGEVIVSCGAECTRRGGSDRGASGKGDTTRGEVGNERAEASVAMSDSISTLRVRVLPGAGVVSKPLLEQLARDHRNPWIIWRKPAPHEREGVALPLPPSVIFAEVSDP